MPHRTDKRLRCVSPAYRLFALFMIWVILVSPAYSGESDDPLVQLKVAFIYNFTRFVEWPESSEDRPFVIGVIGDEQIASGLTALESENKRVKGRLIDVRSYRDIDEIGSPEVLFVGRMPEKEFNEIVLRTAGTPVLLVGDVAGYAGRGVAVEFFLVSDVFRKKQRLRFKIDPHALSGRGLNVSAQLMDVAEVLE